MPSHPHPSLYAQNQRQEPAPAKAGAERFIQTSLREWAYARTYPTSAERTKAMQPWIATYNNTRPDSALGGHPPISRLNNLFGFDS